MKYIFEVPSFQDAILAKTAAALWKQIFNTPFDDPKCATLLDSWPNLTIKVRNQVDTLNIPHYTKPSLNQLVKYVDRQLQDWITTLLDHVFGDGDDSQFELFKRITDCSQWTVDGRLNTTDSARLLCRLQSLPVTQRFDIACLFCIHDEIENLWTNFTSLLMEYTAEFDPDDKHLNSLMINLWKDHPFAFTCCEMSYQKKRYFFFRCMAWRNQSGVEYFWSLLTEEEKSKLVLNLATVGGKFNQLIVRIIQDQCESMYDDGMPCRDDSGFGTAIMCFLLSQLDEQQVDAVLFSAFGSMICLPLLFDDLFVQFFMPTLDHIMHLISDDLYYLVISMIGITDREDCLHACRVKECLTDLLARAPSAVKSRVSERIVDFWFPELFEVWPCSYQDLLNIELLLSDLSVEKVRGVLSKCLLKYDFAHCKLNLDLLVFVAKKFITCGEEMAIFKRDCSIAYKVTTNANVSNENQQKIDRFLKFCLLD